MYDSLAEWLTRVYSFHREKDTQTKKDNYTNVPKPQTYLAGLRGCGMDEPTNMVKVDLTLDVDQN